MPIQWDPRDPLATAAVAEIVARGKALEAEHDGHEHRWRSSDHLPIGEELHHCLRCVLCDRFYCEIGE